MLPTRKGALHLFRFAGIDVFLHWSWFVVAWFEIQQRTGRYSSVAWNALEYLSLFAIVLMHEFGHALACRQVGGRTHDIVLWPLGGVAFVSPPSRPGATLWSIAAGPLVNAVLAPILFFATDAARDHFAAAPNLYFWLRDLAFINLVLLIFNLLPIYPLDGGQILHALLWFKFGKVRSLLLATTLGFVGVAGFVALAVWQQNFWIGIMAAFVFIRCRAAWTWARQFGALPRHRGFACPACRADPLIGEFWTCDACGARFDAFKTGAVCPQCGKEFPTTACPECRAAHPIRSWTRGKHAGSE